MSVNKKAFLPLLLVLVGIYFVFILIAPFFINLKDDKAIIQKNVIDSTALKIDCSDIHPYATPLLGFGVTLDNFVLNYANDWPVAKSKKATFEIFLPALLFKNIKFNKIVFDSPQVDYNLVNKNQSNIDLYLKNSLRLNEDKETKEFFELYTITPSDVILKDYSIGSQPLFKSNSKVFTGKKFIIPKAKVTNYVNLKTKGIIHLK